MAEAMDLDQEEHFPSALFVEADEEHQEERVMGEASNEDDVPQVEHKNDESLLGLYQEYVPYGVYSGAVGSASREYECVREELSSAQEGEDVNWCFMCNMSPSNSQNAEYALLTKQIEELGTRNPLNIIKDIQKTYNYYFKERCDQKRWFLKCIEKHIFTHGGASREAQQREQGRVLSTFMFLVAEKDCLRMDKNTGEVTANPDGIGDYMKLVQAQNRVS